MFIDIAFNASSHEFKYNLEEIIQECKSHNVMPILVGLDLESSKKAEELSISIKTGCFVGVHPLSTGVFFAMNEHFNLEIDNIIGIGECGIDLYRDNNSEYQIELFKKHLEIQGLPFFYHCRNAFSEVFTILKSSKNPYKYFGVIHSFDGSLEQAMSFIKCGLFIGINGCSLKSEDNVKVVKEIPLENILIESDSPYCLIRKSYAASKYIGVIKARENYPINVIQIAIVISKIKNIDINVVESTIFNNTLRAFPKLRKLIEFWN